MFRTFVLLYSNDLSLGKLQGIGKRYKSTSGWFMA
jgi:hypothetical protein